MFDYVTAMHSQNSHDSSEESKTGLSNQKKKKKKGRAIKRADVDHSHIYSSMLPKKNQ